MSYNLSSADRQALSFFVPDWFIEDILSEKEEGVIKNKIVEELRLSHKLLERPVPDNLEQQAEDLYQTYLVTMEDYKENE